MGRLFVLAPLICSVTYTTATEELTRSAFKKLTKSGRNGMVKFYQPWCSHCTAMKEDWDKLAQEAHPSIFIKDVNCAVEDDLCQDLKIKGYPTIMVYNDGDVDSYTHDRSFDELLDYVDTWLVTLCDVKKPPDTCSPKATKYISKWSTKNAADIENEVGRLVAMVKNPMARELRAWLRERLVILRQLQQEEQPEEKEL